jgi:hypothetical protein
MKNDDQTSRPRLVLIRCNDDARRGSIPTGPLGDMARAMYGYPPMMTSSGRRTFRSML